MVEGVEEIGTKHELMALERHLKIFGDAEIHNLLTVAEESVASNKAAAKVLHVRQRGNLIAAAPGMNQKADLPHDQEVMDQ